MNEEKQGVIRFLFDKMMEENALLPTEILENPHKESIEILVKDYIAGMTDQFALDLYDKLK